MNPSEYNALLHAIWNIDRLLKTEGLSEREVIVLNRDREALSGLHQRLSTPTPIRAY